MQLHLAGEAVAGVEGRAFLGWRVRRVCPRFTCPRCRAYRTEETPPEEGVSEGGSASPCA